MTAPQHDQQPQDAQQQDRQPRSRRRRTPEKHWWFALGLAAVFGLAVTVRLTSSLRGAGLHGLGNYDDGVHFAAALGLVNGLLPYRDFLLLHPPGVVLALAPFAGLSWLIGEPDAMAVARVSWMVLGGLNAVLCGLALRPFNRTAGLLAALCYALSFGAIYGEHTPLLEAPATTALLAALVITRLTGTGAGIGRAHYLVAGLVLGLSPVLKIWGVVAVLVVVVAVAARRGRGPALQTLGGAVATCVAACLPFFLPAPQEMWRMVVVAQMGRRRVAESLAERLNDILGLREWVDPSVPPSAGVGLALLMTVAAVATVICLIRVELRVVAALTITHGLLLLVTPMWFLHYASLTAAPLALTVGGAAGALLLWSRAWPGRLRVVVRVVVAGVGAGILVLALPLRDADLGERTFPAAELAAAATPRDGCLTTDWPMTLIQMDLLQRDIDRGCRFVVDLGGYSYYHVESAYHQESRRKNHDWQELALDYYRSGNTVIAVRFSTASGFSRATAHEISRWPVIAKADRYVLRRPQPAGP